jgi:hypothetical protein
MDQDSLKDYHRGLAGILQVLLKAHKDLKFLAQLPPRMDFTIRGEKMADPGTYTMLLEKAVQQIVATGTELNAHRLNVESLLRTAQELDDDGNLTAAINESIKGR